jgi:hypothetical protein
MRCNQEVVTPDGEGIYYGISPDRSELLCSVRVYYPTFEQRKHGKPYYLSVRWYLANTVGEPLVTTRDSHQEGPG